MKGRKPLPTALKVLRGNPGKRPLNASEPAPRLAIPRCPKHLNDEARAEWRRVVHEMAQIGMLTLVDRAALAAYCQTYARWVQAEEGIQRTGLIIKTTNGNLIQNPLVGIANTALTQMRVFLIEFGMTPSSRSRLHLAPAEVEEDEFTRYLKQRRMISEESDE